MIQQRPEEWVDFEQSHPSLAGLVFFISLEHCIMPTPNELYDEGTALKEQGDLDGAVAKWQEILAIDPDYVLAHMALGVHLQKLGRNDEAIKHAVRVTELEPNDSFSFTQLSVIYQRCGKIPEAEDAMAKAHAVQMNQAH